MIETNDIILFILTTLGSLIGVNFGGSMLLVMPALLGFGYAPLTILSSTRPAIILQSILGIRMFRKHGDINKVKKLILSFSSMTGAIVGVFGISQLEKNQAIALMLLLIIVLSIIASLKYFLIDYFKRDQGYIYKDRSSLWYFACGFFPAIIGGIVGSGAGLVVVLFSLILLRKTVYSTSYLEKFVSLGHSGTVLVWSLFYGQFDIKISLIVGIGTLIGAYLGAKVTLKLNVYWMYAIVIVLCIIILVRNIISN